MIGIICNQRDEQFFTRKIRTILQRLIKRRNIPVIVFTLKNLNLEDNMVIGSLISVKTLTTVKTQLPLLIFNLAVQNSKSDIKKVRKLMELEWVSLVNLTNRYNQWTITQILSSDTMTKKYILPCVDTNDNIMQNCSKEESFIMKPVMGSDITRIIYIKPTDSGFYVYRRQASYHSTDFDHCIYANGKKKGMLLLKAPDLINNNNKLYTARVCMQRKYNRKWDVLLRSASGGETISDSLKAELDSASGQIVNCINKYIVDMFICFVDFVVDMNGTPYFLGFGGWENNIMIKKANRDMWVQLCKNIMEYAWAFFDIQKRGDDSVD